ncbi:MAG: site-specific integrase, partial [Leptospiraceae bacterium]|nr:site-specific integrase [Leptospiraceae bacterium]
MQLKLIQEFQEYLSTEKGLSENSIYSYKYDLLKFTAYLEKLQINILEVQAKDINKFLMEEKNRQVSSKTLAREVVALRQFYKYLKEENRVTHNP